MTSAFDRLAKSGKALLALPARGRALIKHVPNYIPPRVQIELEKLSSRGRALVQRVPEPVQIELHKLGSRCGRLGREIFAGLLVVGLIAVVAGYGRLNRGPISLEFLVPTIESTINRELVDLEVHIDDAILQRAPEGPGVLFRLRNIRLVDNEGSIVAQAPLAAVGLSGSALLRGRIATGSVDFIGPRLLLFYSPDGGLSLSFTRPLPSSDGREAAFRGSIGTDEKAARNIPPSEAIASKEARGGRQLDVTSTISDVFDRLRRSREASSYLTRFGVQNATVIFDQDGTKTVWQVPDFAIDLEHRKNRSTLAGEAGIGSEKGDWQLKFEVTQSRRQRTITINTVVENLVPAGIATNFPNYGGLLKALDIPLTAETKVELSDVGEFLAAEVWLQLAVGQIVAPWAPNHPMQVDAGDLRIKYHKQDRRIEIGPATLVWGHSRATLVGELRPFDSADGTPGGFTFKLTAKEGVLEAEEYGLPAMAIDDWVAEGMIFPERGQLRLDRFLIRSGNHSIGMSGTVVDAPDSPAIHLAGEVSPMPLDTLKQFWPKLLAPDAKLWIGERIRGGEVAGGRFQIALAPGQLAALKQGGDLPPEAVQFDLALGGMAITYVPDMPPLITGNAKLTVAGRSFNLEVPEAVIPLPSNDHIRLTAGRFSIPDLRQDPPEGEIVFKASGSAKAALELLDHEPKRYASAVGFKPEQFGGAAAGDFSILLPLLRDLEFKDQRINGNARMTDVVATNVMGELDVEGGSIDLHVTEEVLQARGDIIVRGIPAKLDWQRLFQVPDDRQPPLRVSALLDEAKRAKLGMKLDHLVRGPTTISLLIKTGSPDDRSVSLEADLSDSELTLFAMGWSKPRGRAALLQADMVKHDDGAVDLRNFQIAGDEIAISGSVSLDAAHRLKAFHFTDFSFNADTHVEIDGTVREGDVLNVNVRGSSYDGKQFFESLFSPEQGPKRPDDSLGVDLRARINTVVGFSGTVLNNVELTAKQRNGLLVAFEGKGQLNGQAPMAARLDHHEGKRLIRAEARDAGSAFRLIGFYPNIEGGEASLEVHLDAGEPGSKRGTLWARNFVVLGDPVVREVLSDPRSTAALGTSTQRVERVRIVFDQLRAPFAVGQGQFRLGDAYMNGPLLGATMRGRVDFRARTVDLGGTYVPLYGLNSALGNIPLLGNLFVGREGEGLVGITFAIQGPLEEPLVLVNPVSAVAPGIFRQIFEFPGSGTGAYAGPGFPSGPAAADSTFGPTNR